MRDVSDKTKVQDNTNQVSDLNALTIGVLAVPAAIATQRTMMAFPTLDVEQKPLNTMLLFDGNLSKADRKALKALFDAAS
jgi:hypothetical protein